MRKLCLIINSSTAINLILFGKPDDVSEILPVSWYILLYTLLATRMGHFSIRQCQISLSWYILSGCAIGNHDKSELLSNIMIRGSVYAHTCYSGSLVGPAMDFPYYKTIFRIGNARSSRKPGSIGGFVIISVTIRVFRPRMFQTGL